MVMVVIRKSIATTIEDAIEYRHLRFICLCRKKILAAGDLPYIVSVALGTKK